jgi:DNA modification methylase
VARWRVIEGDCIEAMAALPEASVHAICTDPPYGLEFMGKDWDRLGDMRQPGDPNYTEGPGPFGRAKVRSGIGESYSGRRGGESSTGKLETGPDWNGRERARQGSAYPRSFHMRCRVCGRQEFSGTPCECESPDWERIASAPTQLRAMQAWHYAWAVEAYRVLKPGGYLLAFGGTRTYHRLACALEDAGFEIRDSIDWIYGNGFPKSLDVSKAIDAAEGVEGTWVREDHPDRPGTRASRGQGRHLISQASPTERDPEALRHTYRAGSQAAQDWIGWGTALKPAHEPIVVARKPLSGRTVAANVITYGTGALNIDGTRVPVVGEEVSTPASDPAKRSGVVGRDLGFSGADAEAFREAQAESVERTNRLGRWPPNLLLSHAPGCEFVGTTEVESTGGAYPANREAGSYGGFTQPEHSPERVEIGTEIVEAWDCAEGCPIRELDEQAGSLRTAPGPIRRHTDKTRNTYGKFKGRKVIAYDRSTSGHIYGGPYEEGAHVEFVNYGDAGSASRFFPVFRYEPKTPRKERERGKPPGAGRKPINWSSGEENPGSFQAEGTVREVWNHHPTVKPANLMQWLCRLVTPPGGLVLDPFAGSGSTGVGANREGFDFLGIEREPEYVEIARNRLVAEAPLLDIEDEGLGS